MVNNEPITPPENSSVKEDFFSKEMSTMMAGFAILLMISYHLFGFSDWLNDGVGWESSIGYIGKASAELLGVTGGICVQIFALTSGYALMMNPKAYGTWKHRLSRLFKFLLSYWIVNVLFIIIGFINGDTLPGIKDLALNMVGLETGPPRNWVNVPFAWYVSYYIEFVLLTPILIWGFSSNKKVLDCAMAIACTIIVYICRKMPYSPYDLAYNLFPLMSTILGILIAKYNIFSILQRLVTRHLHSALLVCAIPLIIIMRYEFPKLNPIGGFNWSFFVEMSLSFIAALLILFSVELFHRIRSRRFKEFFLLLGGLSMYLWFLHGIFFTGKNFLQSFIYSPKEPILILLLCLAVTLPVAWLLKRFQTYLDSKILSSKVHNTHL